MTAYNGIPALYILSLVVIIAIAITASFLTLKFKDTKPKLSYAFLGIFVLVGITGIIFGTNMNTMALKQHQNQVKAYVAHMGEGMQISQGLEDPKAPITSDHETKVVIDTKQGLTLCVGKVEQDNIKFLCQDTDSKFTIPLESLA